MKTGMMKVGVFVMIAAIALFVVVATASAHPTSIEGLYAMSGFSSCSIGGGPADPGIMEVDYTFYRNGTGSATGWVRSPAPNLAWVTLEFTYTVKDGRIEFTYPNGGFKVYAPDQITFIMQGDIAMSHGVISPDGKTMTISCGPPKVLTVIDSAPFGPPVGTPGYCATTLVGMRLD
jgi:hypothetical protein